MSKRDLDRINAEPIETLDCPFCKIVSGSAHAVVFAEWEDCIAIVPLAPVVPGHLLVLPRAHVTDYTDDPDVTASVMLRAAQLARTYSPSSNLITSKGTAATQSVFHLHVHIVPRRENDGVSLPWDVYGSIW